MTSKPVFIDSSFFKALIDVKDEFHVRALLWWEDKTRVSRLYITSNFILDETFTLVRNHCSKAIALAVRDLLVQAEPSIDIVRVILKDEKDAWQWFEKGWSKLSFTDCVSFAQMKRLGITEVATFDEHFKRAGFHMMST